MFIKTWIGFGLRKRVRPRSGRAVFSTGKDSNVLLSDRGEGSRANEAVCYGVSGRMGQTRNAAGRRRFQDRGSSMPVDREAFAKCIGGGCVVKGREWRNSNHG